MIERLVNALSRRRGCTAAGLIAVSVFSVLILASRELSTDILALLPLRDRVLARHYDFLSSSGALRLVVFDVSGNDASVGFDSLARAARATLAQLEKSGLFEVQGSLGAREFLAFRNRLIVNWPNLFSAADSQWVAARLHADSLGSRLERRLSALYTFSDISADAFGMSHDPFGLAEYGLRKLAAFKPVENMAFRDGFITNASRNRILLLARTKEPGIQSGESARRAASLCGEIEKKLSARNINFLWMGAIRASQDNVKTVRRDVHVTAPVSIILILCICLLIYRRFYFGLIAFIPTLAGIAATLGLFSVFERISIIVLGFSAALLGITIDYAVHYLYHIDDMPDDAHPVRTLSSPILASALTTAAAFGVLVIAGIPGLSQLGSVTAVGIIVVALCAIIVLPALFRSTGTKGLSRKAVLQPAQWFSRIYTAGIHRIGAVIVVIAAGICWYFAPNLEFDGDPGALNGMSSETIAAEKQIEKSWPGLMEGTYLVAGAHTREAAIAAAHEKLQPLIDTLVALNLIRNTSVFSNVVAPQSVQAENRERWKNTFDSNAVLLLRDAFRDVCARYGISAQSFAPYLASVSDIDALELLKMDDFSAAIRKNLLGNYLHKNRHGWYASTAVFAETDTAWKQVRVVAQSFGALAVNDAALGQRVVEIIKTGFTRCVIYIPLVVFLMMLLVLRSFARAAAAFLPPLLAAGMTLGIMALSGIKINIISLMVFAFVFGLGVDYAVLLLHLGSRDSANSGKNQSHAAASVTVAALTTLAGLGVLALAKHPVLATVGTTGLLGIITSYVCAIFCVPAIGRQGKDAGTRREDV